jgi:hypothetical protein
VSWERSLGQAVKVIARGLHTGQVHEPILGEEQRTRLEASPEKEPFDGDMGQVTLAWRLAHRWMGQPCLQT